MSTTTKKNPHTAKRENLIQLRHTDKITTSILSGIRSCLWHTPNFHTHTHTHTHTHICILIKKFLRCFSLLWNDDPKKKKLSKNNLHLLRTCVKIYCSTTCFTSSPYSYPAIVCVCIMVSSTYRCRIIIIIIFNFENWFHFEN
jgi:hypothetical protein